MPSKSRNTARRDRLPIDPLMKELRMIALLREVADPGTGEGAHWAGMRTHRIMTEMMNDLGYSSKLNAEREFLIHEGSPLEIDSRVKAVGDGTGKVYVF